jgi:hypothetical protein
VTDAASDLAVEPARSSTRGHLVVAVGLVVLAVAALMVWSMFKGWAPLSTLLFIPLGFLGIVLVGLGFGLERPERTRDRVILSGAVAVFWVLVGVALLVVSPRWHEAAAAVQPEPTHGQFEAITSTYFDGLNDGLRVEVRQHRSLFPHTWTAICLLNSSARSATGAWTSDHEFVVHAGSTSYAVEVDPTSGGPHANNLLEC